MSGPGAACRMGGVQRQGRDEQGGHAERLVAGGGRVHDGGGARPGGRSVGAYGDGPGDRPVRAQPLLDGPVGEQVGGEVAVRGGAAPAGDAVAGVGDHGEVAVGAAAHGAGRVVADLDDDLLQAGQGEQQGVVDAVQQPLGEVGGGGVAQRQDDGGVVRVGGGALGGEGSRSSGTCPSRRRISSPRPGLCRAVSCARSRASARDQRTPPCRPTTAGSSVTASTAAKPTPNRPTARSGVSRLAEARSVDSDSTPAASSGAPVFAATRTPSRRVSRRRPGTCGPGGGVGGVLREFDDEPVPVAAEDEVLLGVGVLAEPRGAGGPGVQDPTPQTRRTERVGTLGGGPHELAHVDSPHRALICVRSKVPLRDTTGTRCPGGRPPCG